MAKIKKPNKHYELSDVKALFTSDATTLVLGCDPGSANFGIALVGLANGKIKVYANSVLMTPVNDLVNFNIRRLEFLKELSTWVSRKPHGIAAERFQTRGGMGPLMSHFGKCLCQP